MSGPADLGTLRIGAAERDAAAAALGEHLTAGRLELDEFERRIDAATRGRTYADLRPLFSDLPPPHAPAPIVATSGPGFLAAKLRAQLTAEGLVVLAEDLPGTMGFRRYRSPRQRIFYRTLGVRGAVAVSGQRLLIWAAGASRVNLPFAHPLWHAVDVSANNHNWLRVITDVGAFDRNRSGRVVLRLQTDQAAAVAEMFTTGRRRPGIAIASRRRTTA